MDDKWNSLSRECFSFIYVWCFWIFQFDVIVPTRNLFTNGVVGCLLYHVYHSIYDYVCVCVCICVCSVIRIFSWIALNTQYFHLHINSQHADNKVFFFPLMLFHYRYVIKLVDLIHSGVEMVGPKKREMSGIILNYFYSGILASVMIFVKYSLYLSYYIYLIVSNITH